MANLLLKPIAHGRTADVYEWSDGNILKLFHDWFSLEDIEYELKIARAVHASGVKSPAVYELVQVEGRNGLVYERVQGETMTKMFQKKPWKVLTYARTFAQLHAQMHTCIFETEVPRQRTRLQRKIQAVEGLPEALKASLLQKLETLPDDNKVCHGDFHPENILLTPTNATIIDWIDSSSGNPLADVARTSIILQGAIAAGQFRNPLVKILVRLFHETYLNEYFRLHPKGRNEFENWLPIVAAARLLEKITPLENWLLKQAQKG